MGKVLIELQYFGTISWYREVLRYRSVTIEVHENFEKSTYRNRCYIASPEGKLRLTVPLRQGRNQRSKSTEIKIDHSHNWKKVHWNSLCSCYRKSPYFEFYEDKLKPFYIKEYELLYDLNEQLFLLMVELLNLDLEVAYSNCYKKHPDDGVVDLRSEIRPNHTLENVNSAPIIYHQVFQDRTVFLPDLCIVDLLFNEGPHSKERLLSSIID